MDDDDILDEDQFNTMTQSLGIGRRLSDGDRKQIYDVMTARCQQAYVTSQQRVDRLKVELAAEEARYELVGDRVAETKRKLDVFIRQNSADICNFIQSARVSQYNVNHDLEIRPIAAPDRSASTGMCCHGDDSIIGHVGDLLSALMTDYASLRSYTNQILSTRNPDSLPLVRSAPDSRKSRDRTSRTSLAKTSMPRKSILGNSAKMSSSSGFAESASQRQPEERLKAKPTQETPNGSSKTNPVYTVTKASRVFMKCDVTVKRQQMNTSGASVSAAVSVSVTDTGDVGSYY